ncbi:MAG: Bifunctional protein FolD protein [Candidatus Heimdallarchaeota archaeon LC_3]|nr:MAG: Bifunctional protein FolD protein [Candidatus Heimdallarchaeota archaeon LC_3]
MNPTILDGKATSLEVKERLKKRVEKLPKAPTLSIVYVGNDPASAVYTRNKVKTSKEIGIDATLHRFEKISEEALIDFIEHALETDDGIIVQLPLPNGMDEEKILDTIKPEQDVDGLHWKNIGKRILGDKDAFWPCTPLGIIEILDRYKIEIEGKHAVVIGRSNLVGKPIASLLEKRNATVTQCHSRSKPISRYTLDADIIITAIGITKFLKADMIKEGVIIVDVGINRDENGKLCGDVDFKNVKDKCSYITPVPGGVGPMTVVELMFNTVLSAEKKLNH